MEIIKVFEYTHLSINDKFTSKHFDQIVNYNERHGNKFFNIGHNRVYFKNYVGVLQIGNLIIEILPKADKLNNKEIQNKWHNALIYMLHISGFLNIDSISQADLKIQNMTIIDIFYKEFIQETKSIVHNGLIRKYRFNEGNRTFLKGRLIFNKHISQNLLHKEKFYTSAQIYDHDNPFNQILLKALKILKSNGKNNRYYDEVDSLLFSLDFVSDKHISEKTFNSLQYTRNSVRYKKAIILAKMIIQNYYPDMKTGQNNLIGLLFDMNLLYEKVIFKLLKKHEKQYQHCKLKLHYQYSKQFWKGRTIRPDIFGEYVSENDPKLTKKWFVIDTKWKHPNEGKPSDADLKQMFSYNIHFGAHSSVLVYPDYGDLITMHDKFYDSVSTSFEHKNHFCSTYYIDLFDEAGKIKPDSGISLLNQITSA